MPELPEVETVVRRLAEILTGKVIKSVDLFEQKSFYGEVNNLVGTVVIGVKRRAKMIIIELNDQKTLLTHLKMTGQLIYRDDQHQIGGGHPSADWVGSLPSSHTRIQYLFDDNSQLFFNDQRKFGWMKLLKSDDLNAEFRNYAPDVNTDDIHFSYLKSALKNKSVPIKVVLMDNGVMSGVGNIYACEALNIAQISPFRSAKSLTDQELEKLLHVTKAVINKAIELNGTTFDGKYVGVDGTAGSYQQHAVAYGREGSGCYNCGAKIVKQKLAGRGTYFCPACQI